MPSQSKGSLIREQVQPKSPAWLCSWKTQADRAVWTISHSTLLCAQGESLVKCLRYGKESANACVVSPAAGTSPPCDLITDKRPPPTYCSGIVKTVKRLHRAVWEVEVVSVAITGICVTVQQLVLKPSRSFWAGCIHGLASMFPVVSIAKKKKNIYGGEWVLLLPRLSAGDQWILGDATQRSATKI